MSGPTAGEQRFRASIEGSEKGRAYVVLPFDPAAVWGARSRYHVTGTINGRPFRGPVERSGVGFFLSLGPAWRRDNGLAPGNSLAIALRPEGPQADALDPDIAAALAADLEAARAFDSLPTFYRKGYLRWIAATKRRPDVRAARIAEMARRLKAGLKDHP